MTREVKVYTEEDHLNHKSELIKDIYEKLKERVLELDDIDIDVKKCILHLRVLEIS